MTEHEHKTLVEALVAVQLEMPAIEPDAENAHFRNRFVTLGHLLAKARPILNRHGFAVMQAPSLNDEGTFVLRTRLLHTSGEEVSFDYPLTPTKNDPQGQGSAITYARRYALASALAISDQEDDDGNQGSVPKEKAKAASNGAKAEPRLLPEDAAVRLMDAVVGAGLEDSLKAKLRSFGVKELTDLTVEQGIELHDWCSREVGAEAVAS